MLSLNDKWIWDFWFAENNGEHHIFYLQAPKSLVDERRRHHNATIGHAVSSDYKNWTVLPNALATGAKGEWDDLATWTGSVIKHEDLWYMLYTGVNHNEKGLIQRIGLATSTDLVRWDKYKNNPIISADEKYYEMLDLNSWHDHAWRDPCVFKYQNSFHAFITARVNYGPVDGRGVIAHAISPDLINWNIQAPVTEPGYYGQLEVPQLIYHNNKYILIFSTAAEHHSNKLLTESKVVPVTGTNFLIADNPLGPYKLNMDKFLIGDKAGSFYAGKIIENNTNNLALIAFQNYKEDGDFIGLIADPLEVQINF